MCGIVGIINFNKSESHESENIKKMADAIKHRGPDDERYLFFNSQGYRLFRGDDSKDPTTNKVQAHLPSLHIGETKSVKSFLTFGFRRLSILDLSPRGHQPMSYLNKYWIVFNGEIYNYLELKDELKNLGYEFNSDTDTEVIMAAYDYWGSDCLNKFNGMWAFVIYNSENGVVFISRDRFGVKPLYYFTDHNKIIFASEIKALLKNSQIETKPNLPYIKDFLKTFPKEYENLTSFENVFRFPNAHFVEFDINKYNGNNFYFTKYYELKCNISNEEIDKVKTKNYADDYLLLLKDAVKLRLRADVPVGTSFSGGLDSSSVVYLVNEQLKLNSVSKNQKTFSLVFKENKEIQHLSEEFFINELVKELKIEANFIDPTLEDVKGEYAKTIFAMENPQDDMLLSCMFTYKLYKQRKVTVAIDGQGADELQAGYLRYLTNYFSNLPFTKIYSEYKKITRIPNSKREVLLGIIFKFIGSFGLEKIAKLLLTFWNKYKDPFLHPSERLLEDFQHNLQNLLHFGDRSSMIYSVESRFPFLDFRLVEFWMNLSFNYKINEGWTKYLARVAFNEKLPDSITWRKDKMGWEIPQNYWFERVFLEDAKYLFANCDIVKKLKLKKEIEKHLKLLKNSNESFKRILKIYNLCLWYEIFINKSIGLDF